jgi:hypothetical protein
MAGLRLRPDISRSTRGLSRPDRIAHAAAMIPLHLESQIVGQPERLTTDRLMRSDARG